MAPERKKLEGAALAAAMAAHPGWTTTADGLAIERRFVFRGFGEAFAFMTEIALAAERLDHHPDWTNVWNRVDLRLTTHDRGGITAFDLALAEACDRAAAGRLKGV
ncbi:MAG: 4a-hydroxytetrahydrobiopterin dehydratase [Phyllobacteriaceae bacterium]|nr:4a-hydroxytetrahydrobiopterin dehydratase [Phyllobacteriaceae bacterium]